MPAEESTAALQSLGRAERLRWLTRHRAAWTPALVVRLAEEVTAHTQVDLGRAEAWLGVVEWLAARVDDDAARARTARAGGHVASLRGRYAVALRRYCAALDGFRRARMPLEAAITRSGALQTLIYLGRYREALQWAARARRVFVARGDHLRLARLETNVANILHRHDRFEEALARYQTALDAFVAGRHGRDEAIVLRNMAVCYIGLTRFAPAIATYERARTRALELGLHGLVPKVDYNIAYLHYLRGDYQRALSLYDEARARCDAAPDPYHAALCDLDQAELALELNLVDEGAALARSAHDRFTALGLNYERAKAVVNMGIAAQRAGDSTTAEVHYRRAHRLFAREDNRVWMALLDLYAALASLEAGHPRKALPLARTAERRLARSPFADRSAFAAYILARIHAALGRTTWARAACERALGHLEHHPVRALAYRVWHLLGRMRQQEGNDREATRAFEQAHVHVEALRGQLGTDNLKVAFLQDKLAVYESLVRVTLTGRAPKLEKAFCLMEQAKSRTLVEQMSARTGAADAPNTLDATRVREELSGRYRARDALQTARQPSSADRERRAALERDIQRLERTLARTNRRTERGAEPTAAAIEDVQASLDPKAALVEYYVAEGRMLGWVLTHRDAAVHDLGPIGPIAEAVRYLQFQLSAPRWRDRNRMAPGARAAVAHLEALHQLLIAPLASLDRAEAMVVVPHGSLHAVPFAALWDGVAFLGERRTCSVSPSATAFVRALQRPSSRASGALVVGVPDPHAPRIDDEVHRVAARFAEAVVLEGEAATRARFTTAAPGARMLHLATHGRFRADNPWYSSIELWDGPVTLHDLDALHLDADLVALSGCATGRSVAVGGDELFGLTRGLLLAGARSLLVSLWDVSDETTSLLVDAFYLALQKGLSRGEAIRVAAAEVRRTYPHPYHWAPFTVVGDPRPIAAPIFSATRIDPSVTRARSEWARGSMMNATTPSPSRADHEAPQRVRLG